MVEMGITDVVAFKAITLRAAFGLIGTIESTLPAVEAGTAIVSVVAGLKGDVTNMLGSGNVVAVAVVGNVVVVVVVVATAAPAVAVIGTIADDTVDCILVW
jgi:hypothetical protein